MKILEKLCKLFGVIRGRNKINDELNILIEALVLRYYAEEMQEPMFHSLGYFKAFDGSDFSQRFRLEIKFEALAARTGNLCLEQSYKRHPSGLAATKAQIWTHVVPIRDDQLRCLEFDTDTLRREVKDYQTYWGGDGKQSEFKLLPIARAEKIMLRDFVVRIRFEELKPYLIER
jgi:hypothetical protein